MVGLRLKMVCCRPQVIEVNSIHPAVSATSRAANLFFSVGELRCPALSWRRSFSGEFCITEIFEAARSLVVEEACLRSALPIGGNFEKFRLRTLGRWRLFSLSRRTTSPSIYRSYHQSQIPVRQMYLWEF